MLYRLSASSKIKVLRMRDIVLLIVTILLEVFLPCTLLNKDAFGNTIGLTEYHYYDIFIFKQGITYPLITCIATLLAAVLLILFTITKKIAFAFIEAVIMLSAIIITIVQIPNGTFGYGNIIIFTFVIIIFITQTLDCIFIKRLQNRS